MRTFYNVIKKRTFAHVLQVNYNSFTDFIKVQKEKVCLRFKNLTKKNCYVASSTCF